MLFVGGSGDVVSCLNRAGEGESEHDDASNLATASRRRRRPSELVRVLRAGGAVAASAGACGPECGRRSTEAGAKSSERPCRLPCARSIMICKREGGGATTQGNRHRNRRRAHRPRARQACNSGQAASQRRRPWDNAARARIGSLLPLAPPRAAPRYRHTERERPRQRHRERSRRPAAAPLPFSLSVCRPSPPPKTTPNARRARRRRGGTAARPPRPRPPRPAFFSLLFLSLSSASSSLSHSVPLRPRSRAPPRP